ncbi:hypothetical protein [Xylanimonas protaetiae]|uniref:hypothetical protein n=1 Tax=Xylanimonas protaetiae TaxID=2509457 RepID=UPI001F5D6FF9|nr:hypothetical protein [Xylanimonas protaetiae]
MSSTAALQLCVLLWARPGQDDALTAYEDAVLALLPDHGARLVTRVRRATSSTVVPLDVQGWTDDVTDPLEVQVIELPSRAALDAYLRDPRRTALDADRDAAVDRTRILEVTARTGA